MCCCCPACCCQCYGSPPLVAFRSVHNSGETDCTRQSSASPVQVQHLVPRCCREDHQTQLLISGGVERRLHLDLTVFKGQGHYPPFPGLFVCLMKRAGACRPRCLSRAGGASFNSGMGHLRHERAHPVGRRPRRHFSRRSKAPFFSRSFNLRNAVFQPQLLWVSVGFCGVGHHGITKLLVP